MLDALTIEVATITLSGAMALFLAWTWFAQKLSNALVWWSASYALAAAATLLILMDKQQNIPHGLNIEDVLHISSAFFLWFGFRSFNGQRVFILPMVAVCAVYVTAVEFAVDATSLSRQAFIDMALIIVIGLSVLSISEVVTSRRAGNGWRRLATMILIGHSAVLFVRVLLDDRPYLDMGGFTYALEAGLIIEPAVMPVLLGYTLLALAFERRNAATETMAERDALTGTLNRRGLHSWLAAGRHEVPLSVIVFDIDHFKRINDTHGHAVGDGVLEQVAARITSEIRGGDAFARIGGEEFVVLIPGTGEQGARVLAERMRVALCETPLTVGDVSLSVTSSFGVHVISSASMDEVDQAISLADEALYAAKRGGRNRVELVATAHAQPS